MAAPSPRRANLSWHVWVTATLGAVLLGVFIWLARSAVAGSALAAWDADVTETMLSWRTPGLDRAFWVVTLIGNVSILGAMAGAVAVILALWGRRAEAALVAVGTLVAQGLSSLSKALIGRARPLEDLALITQPGSDSMPSGHALLTVVFYGLLVYLALRALDGRRRSTAAGPTVVVAAVVCGVVVTVAAVAVVAAVGLSRVYLGVHWISDVLGGWCLGGVWLCLVLGGFSMWNRSGRSWGALHRAAPEGRRSLRLPLVGILILLVGLAVGLTAWADPLL